MRVNIYAEEMTNRVELVTKEIEGQTFTAVRFYLELPASFLPPNDAGGQLRQATTESTEQARHFKAPFIHRPGDDDSSAVTFWGKSDLRPMLKKALDLLDEHYAKRHPATLEPAVRMSTTGIKVELETLGKRWDDLQSNCEGHGGSPGEWMYERMDELETELKKRALATGESF